MRQAPFVSVVLPVRNEGKFLVRTLERVLDQDYPANRMEVLVVDGESVDETPEIVARMAASDSRLRLLQNPSRHVAEGLNRGIRECRGEIVVRVDGHCAIPPHYVSTCVQLLQEGVAECVGGPPRAVGTGWMGAAIALAMTSPLGVGGASFRYTERARYVDHVPFGAYWRGTFESLGLFDPELVRNQDDEFSSRLIQAGGRIYVDPAISAEYWSRSTLRGLWLQYFGYGYYKVRVIRKRGKPSSLRQLVPPVFLLGLLASALAAVGTGRPGPLGVVWGGYAAFVAAGTAATLIRRRRWEAVLLPAVLATMHLAYGSGFLASLVVEVASHARRVPVAAPNAPSNMREGSP